MSIKRLNYLDIPQPLRAQKAGEVQGRLQALLSDPSTSFTQRDFALKQLKVLQHWLKGTLPTGASTTDYHQIVETIENV